MHASLSVRLPVEIEAMRIDADAHEVVERALAVARERLGMEIGWLAEFRGDRKVFRVVEGALDEWGLYEDQWMPLADSYCQRMECGEIPNAIPDTGVEPVVATLDVTGRMRIGAYVGVPLVGPDGALRGAFCCARHTPHHSLTDRDVEFMKVMARLVADELAFREALRELRRLERRAAATSALAAAVEARDHYTAEHSTAVVDLAVAVGRRLGLDEEQLENVEHVALLHDVGKLGIPDAVLRKPGPLTEEEWVVMRRHPAMGADLVAAVEHVAHLAPAIRAEHERWDGRGYPHGLAGEQIPVASRITLVCDALHAMVSDRPYRTAMSHDDALAELQRCAGTMFWPAAVDALLAELNSGPPTG